MQSELGKTRSISDPQKVMPEFLHPLVLEQVFLFCHPIGSYYYNKIDSRNPSQIFGLGCGTWVAEEGVVLVGKAPVGTFATLGSIGGAETHTLTSSQIPAHTHPLASNQPYQVSNSIVYGYGSGAKAIFNDGSLNSVQANIGGGGAHNNLQPYRTVMMWVRTA